MKLTALLLTALLGVATAEDKKPAEPAKPTEPAKPADPAKPAETPAPAEEKVFVATDLAALKEMLGKKVTVAGTILGSGATKTETIHYLNYTKDFKQSVSLVIFANADGGKFTKEKLAGYLNKKVQATGTLTDRNGALQIKIEKEEQLKVLE